jgi:X-X-X-Leu-X-X-Gly heptad repeat protein
VSDVAEIGQFRAPAEPGERALSPREIRFVNALSVGRSPSEAANEIGLSDRSGRRWRKKPEIIEAIRARLSENIAVGRSILASGMAKAATGLVEMASGAAEADAARVSACRAVTEGAVKLCELADLQQQLAEIQQQLATVPGNQARRF